MRVALWTPSPDAAWAAALAAELGPEFVVVSAEPQAPPPAEVDLYHVAGSPAHAFVYRALLRRPGIVLLAEWGLHTLVHAETAGRGDPDAYRREARRAHGDKGEFVARQVLGGLGGALLPLLAMNQRVLDASLALVAFDEPLRQRAAALMSGRPVVHLPLERAGAGGELAALATSLRALAFEVAARAEVGRREIAALAVEERSLPGAATGELRWAARELGLAEPPADAVALVTALFGNAQ